MMSRRWFTWLAVTALAVAVLFLVADPASAQRRGGVQAGFSPRGGVEFGYGHPYYGYGSGYGYGSSYYGRGYYPGYYSGGWSGYRWGEPGYRWSNDGYYSSTTPSYYSEGMQGDFYNSDYQAGAYGAINAPTDHQVLINVRVPPNAEVWFDDQKTSQSGALRTFVSPPLDADHNFVYQIKARWNEDGRQVEKTRKIEVHPGDRLLVNFIRPQMREGQYGTEGEMRQGDRSLERRDRTLDNRDRNREENADRTLDRNQPRNPNAPRTPQNERPQGETPRQPDSREVANS